MKKVDPRVCGVATMGPVGGRLGAGRSPRMRGSQITSN